MRQAQKAVNIPKPIPLQEKCDYCGADLNAVSAKKRFCGDICRMYFKRKKDKGLPTTSVDTSAESPLQKKLRQNKEEYLKTQK